ncbi:DNA-binding transcriptional ArsR family regulator [Streptomyces sp. TLI_55]|uniref:DUF5937 family protein n=1 Tax=Streptomyces sp. TLI_55 TaxID=1938861 RepID=UPI000BCA3ACE|nr:DUF5937 family protein [Streptomyces sp. TLI_55]SNX55986.1 DNA-binding transcriptional ArsR family regulator [Streptomyces sp. TLI_55]
MLRFHFTPEDLTRLTVAAGPHPLWEVAASLHRFQTRDGRWAHALWYRTARSTLHRTGLDRTVMPLLLPLFPRASYFPDFLTPTEGVDGLDAGLESILATPRHRVTEEVTRLCGTVGGPAWAHRVAERETRGELVHALRAYHHAVIAPHEEDIHERLYAERARHARTLLRAGTEAVLAGLSPAIRWRHPVLEIPGYPRRRDVHLDGRGLLLIPSYFCWDAPVALADPGLPPVLLYPVQHVPTAVPRTDAAPLNGLLGPTRAAVLRAAAAGATTTEAARYAGVTPATASHHTTLLRDAGLITSHRYANTVVHTLTPLGAALLRRDACGEERQRHLRKAETGGAMRSPPTKRPPAVPP